MYLGGDKPLSGAPAQQSTPAPQQTSRPSPVRDSTPEESGEDLGEDQAAEGWDDEDWGDIEVCTMTVNDLRTLLFF